MSTIHIQPPTGFEWAEERARQVSDGDWYFADNGEASYWNSGGTSHGDYFILRKLPEPEKPDLMFAPYGTTQSALSALSERLDTLENLIAAIDSAQNLIDDLLGRDLQAMERRLNAVEEAAGINGKSAPEQPKPVKIMEYLTDPNHIAQQAAMFPATLVLMQAWTERGAARKDNQRLREKLDEIRALWHGRR